MKLLDRKEKLLGNMGEQQRQTEVMNKNVKELQTRAQPVLMEQVRSSPTQQKILTIPVVFLNSTFLST
jgi:hypothetical protein